MSRRLLGQEPALCGNLGKQGLLLTDPLRQLLRKVVAPGDERLSLIGVLAPPGRLAPSR